jgi:hypothetical protein
MAMPPPEAPRGAGVLPALAPSGGRGTAADPDTLIVEDGQVGGKTGSTTAAHPGCAEPLALGGIITLVGLRQAKREHTRRNVSR